MGFSWAVFSGPGDYCENAALTSGLVRRRRSRAPPFESRAGNGKEDAGA
jgi:hypothetical protein